MASALGAVVLGVEPPAWLPPLGVPPAASGHGTLAKGRQSRCCHGWRKCSFCRFPTPAPRTRLRCACCGRFTTKAEHTRCARCGAMGYVALRLF